MVFFEIAAGGIFSSYFFPRLLKTGGAFIGAPIGTIKMELFADVVPKSAENFRQL